ncbi:MAG: hypothetical protein AB7F32_10700 [Victivallaceae bacterium]
MMVPAAVSGLLLSAFALAAVTAEELAAARGVIRIDQPVAIAKDLTFDAATELEFSGDGRFELARDVTVIIDGRLSADMRQIFSGPGKVAGRVRTAAVYPQWFGARGDGVADDAPALQRAADLARTSAFRKLVIPDGRYRIESGVKFRCNIDAFGTLVRVIEVDEKKVDQFSYMPMYSPLREALVSFEPDEEWIELDPAAFGGIKEGSFKLPKFAALDRADGKGKIELAPGGTLKLSSTDFFTSRKNVKSDEVYTKNDICEIVSPQGDVFPEFCFSYQLNADGAEPWNAERSYRRGDYCTVDGKLFKSRYPSGPGSEFPHRFKGNVPIGPRSPREGEEMPFKYADGSADAIRLWAEVKISARYAPPQIPLTVNNLVLEVSAIDAQNRMKPIRTASMAVRRSGMTFNRLNVRCIDRYALISTLVAVTDCCNVVFNDSGFSGATFNGLGYNIVNGNAAHIVYNNCVSVNARKGMAGRHGKNITVNGGHYNLIDDHYGINYVIRNAVINAVSTVVPGYTTPETDVSKWYFAPSYAFVFCGRNFSISNCQVYNATGLFGSRSDVADCGGVITLRDIAVYSDENVMLFRYEVRPDFDYAHAVLSPAQADLSNITIVGKGRGVISCQALGNAARFPLRVVDCGPIGSVSAENADLTFRNCRFIDAEFKAGPQARFELFDNRFNAAPKGLPDNQLLVNTGTLVLPQ